MVYLLQHKSTIGTINIDPVHIAKGGQGSRPASSASTRMQTPDRSSMPPPLLSPEKQAVENVLKAVTKSKIGVRTIFWCKAHCQSSKFRDCVVARDKGCIVYGTIPDHCKASHIIPASLVKVIQFMFDINFIVQALDYRTHGARRWNDCDR